MKLEEIPETAEQYALTVVAGIHPEQDKTILILGPKEPDFWRVFSTSPEYSDGEANSLDRWSKRVVDTIAMKLSAHPVYPFGGSPFHPFIRWALDSEQIWQSPVQLLVDNSTGLFVSFRGALVIDEAISLPSQKTSPCVFCVEKPCLSACPAAALGGEGYDVPACHNYLNSQRGSECLNNGCLVRRACPVGQNTRLPAQSAFHMRAFHKG